MMEEKEQCSICFRRHRRRHQFCVVDDVMDALVG